MYEAERTKWTQGQDISETMGHLQRKTVGSERSQYKGEAIEFVGTKDLAAHIILPGSPDSRQRVVTFKVCFHGLWSCVCFMSFL